MTAARQIAKDRREGYRRGVVALIAAVIAVACKAPASPSPSSRWRGFVSLDRRRTTDFLFFITRETSMKMPTLGQASAFGRHVLSYAMGAITMAAAVHVVNGQDASSLTTAVTNIANGVTSIAGGIATIVSVGAGLYAAWSASPLAQLLAVAKNVDVKQVVVATPATANAVPSDKVVAK